MEKFHYQQQTNFYNNKSLTIQDMRRILSFCMVALMTMLYASQASAVDFVEMQLDTDYHPSGYYQAFYGKYTATESGKLKVSYTVNGVECYLDEALSQQANLPWNGNYPATYNMEVTAGTTYYFTIVSSSAEPGYTLKLELQKAFAIESIEPAEGSALTTTTGADVLIRFNNVPKAVSYARLGIASSFSTTNWNATTKKGSIKCITQLVGTTLSVDYSAALQQLFDEGDLKPGDELTLALRLQDDTGSYWLGNGNGIHKLSFVAGSQQANLVSEKIPSKILSYMDPSNEDGKLILTFDQPLATDIAADQIRFAYGNIDSTDLDNEYTEVNIPFSVDGNSLIVDFTGVSRKRIELLPGSKNLYDSFTVKIMGIKDAAGTFVKSPGAGTVGSFSYLIPYEELEALEITHEFIPASGSSLEGVEKINLWVNNLDKFTFDGIRIDYRNEDGDRVSKLIPLAELKNNSSDPAELDVDIVIPAEMINATDVNVYLENVKTQDGFDHSEDVLARYDAFCILNITPEPGATMDKLAKGTVITFSDNWAEQYPDRYLTYSLVDNNPVSADQATLLSSYVVRQEDGTWGCEIFYDVDLFAGHSYSFIVNAFENELATQFQNGGYLDPLSSDKVKWFGSQEPFRFSSFAFESITPSTTSKIVSENQRKFTLTFDGLVTLSPENCYILKGKGQTEPFESLVPVDPQDEIYSNVWEATISEEFMATLADYLNLSFKAYDRNGLLIEGNMGEEKYSYFYFNYEVSFSIPEFGIEPANGSEVEKISEYRLSFAEGIAPSYVASEKIRVMAGTETVYEFKEADFSYEIGNNEKGDEINVAMILTLPEPITKAGDYELIVPEKYLNLGQEEATRFNGEQRCMLTVPVSEVDPPVQDEFVPEYVTTPAEGTLVNPYFPSGTLNIDFTNLSKIAAITGVTSGTNRVYFYVNGVGQDVSWRLTAAYKRLGLQVPTGYYGASVKLADGVYKYVIPADYFILTDNDGVEHNNPEITLVYTVGDTVGVDSVFGNDNLFDVYEINGTQVLKNADKDALKALRGLYIINGKAYILN